MIGYHKYNDKDLCCGCRACEQICPKNAIEMKNDSEGFLYPIIDKDRCIDCSLCNNVCPIENVDRLKCEEIEIVYAAYSVNRNIRRSSSSGGIFAEIASYVLGHKGVVYGASFQDGLILQHCRISAFNEISLLSGSKYLQSDTGETYKNVKEDLRNGLLVYYVGTPCQIAGLRSFLKYDYSNLITSDLICHGVPSQLMFDSYIEHLNQKLKGKIVTCNFRKFAGWGMAFFSELKKNGKIKRYKIDHFEFSSYLNAFKKSYINRPICYSCPFAQKERVGDITLGDYWGVTRFLPDIDYCDGVSLILINSLKGQNIFDNISSNLKFYISNFESASVENPNLRKSTPMPLKRKDIYNELERRGYGDLDRKEFRTKGKCKLFFRYKLIFLLDALGIKKIIKQICQKK